MTEDLHFYLGIVSLAMVILAGWLLFTLLEGARDVLRSLNESRKAPPVPKGRQLKASRPIPFYPESPNHWRIS